MSEIVGKLQSWNKKHSFKSHTLAWWKTQGISYFFFHLLQFLEPLSQTNQTSSKAMFSKCVFVSGSLSSLETSESYKFSGFTPGLMKQNSGHKPSSLCFSKQDCLQVILTGPSLKTVVEAPSLQIDYTGLLRKTFSNPASQHLPQKPDALWVTSDDWKLLDHPPWFQFCPPEPGRMGLLYLPSWQHCTFEIMIISLLSR